jgi:hypothetical protein
LAEPDAEPDAEPVEPAKQTKLAKVGNMLEGYLQEALCDGGMVIKVLLVLLGAIGAMQLMQPHHASWYSWLIDVLCHEHCPALCCAICAAVLVVDMFAFFG